MFEKQEIEMYNGEIELSIIFVEEENSSSKTMNLTISSIKMYSDTIIKFSQIIDSISSNIKKSKDYVINNLREIKIYDVKNIIFDINLPDIKELEFKVGNGILLYKEKKYIYKINVDFDKLKQVQTIRFYAPTIFDEKSKFNDIKVERFIVKSFNTDKEKITTKDFLTILNFINNHLKEKNGYGYINISNLIIDEDLDYSLNNKNFKKIELNVEKEVKIKKNIKLKLENINEIRLPVKTSSTYIEINNSKNVKILLKGDKKHRDIIFNNIKNLEFLNDKFDYCNIDNLKINNVDNSNFSNVLSSSNDIKNVEIKNVKSMEIDFSDSNVFGDKNLKNMPYDNIETLNIKIKDLKNYFYKNVDNILPLMKKVKNVNFILDLTLLFLDFEFNSIFTSLYDLIIKIYTEFKINNNFNILIVKNYNKEEYDKNYIKSFKILESLGLKKYEKVRIKNKVFYKMTKNDLDGLKNNFNKIIALENYNKLLKFFKEI